MKTVEEWSNQFDLLWNNINSNKAPGLELYEKSVFLTDAQDYVVAAIYSGALGDAFESSEKVTAFLDSLVKQGTGTLVANAPYKIAGNKSYVYKNPEGMLFRTWEACTITTSCGDVEAVVKPTTQDEYWRTSRSPFRKQNARRVLRLDYSQIPSSGSDYESRYSELISDYPITEYRVRYIAQPDPIILANDLASRNLSIHGKTDQMTCKLPEAVHQTILAEAVRMAKAIWKA